MKSEIPVMITPRFMYVVTWRQMVVGWIVIQRRNANFERVNFTRNWEDYVNGFGDGQALLKSKIHHLNHRNHFSQS